MADDKYKDWTAIEWTIYSALEDDVQIAVDELLDDGYDLYEALEELGLLN